LKGTAQGMASYWNRVRHIVAEARELVCPARERFVDRACAGDAELRHEVGSLLRGVHEVDRFLEDLAARSGIPFAGRDDAPPPGLGHTSGRIACFGVSEKAAWAPFTWPSARTARLT
jgi:hypothetical protein